MKLRKIFSAITAVVSLASFGVCIYGICYETLDAFAYERATGGIFDLTPYLILITAVIFLLFTILTIILVKK
ncbi:MAG: hypothetical protein U0M02_09300 [Acutalibacteraceae bacterium]|nr:hypothetical protein [Acutalibacteraceae bacterium]